MITKEPQPIFFKTIPVCIFIICFGLYLLVRDGKEKTEFQHVTGKIILFEQTYRGLHERHSGKHRYIQLDTEPNVFEFFIGQDPGDFSPKFEQLDQLALGDEVTIYFSEKTPFQKNSVQGLNQNAQFLDKQGEAYFIRGNKDKYFGYFFIAIGAILIITLFFLKQAGKIK